MWLLHLWWKDVMWMKRNIASTLGALLLLPLLVGILAAGFIFLMVQPNKPGFEVKTGKKVLVAEATIEDLHKFKTTNVMLISEDSDDVNANDMKKLSQKLAWVKDMTGKDMKRIGKQFEKRDGLILVKKLKLDISDPKFEYQIQSKQLTLKKSLWPPWGPLSIGQATESNTAISRLARAQHLINEAFLELLKATNANGTTGGQVMGSVKHSIIMPWFNYQVQRLYGFMGRLSAVVCFWNLIHMARQIREEGPIKANLRQYKIFRIKYFSSFFLMYSIRNIISLVILWLPAMICAQLLLDPIFIPVAVILYAFDLAAFAILISTLFRTETSAFFGAMLLLLIAHIGLLGFGDLSPDIVHFLSAIVFPNAFYFYTGSIAHAFMLGEMHITTIVILICSVLALIIDAILMVLLAIYVDCVFPFNNKLQKPYKWYFFFLKSSWSPISGDPIYESDKITKESYHGMPGQPKSEDTKSKAQSEMSKQGSEMEMPVIVTVDGVCLKIGSHWVVNTVSFKVKQGELLVMYGSRGSGHQEILEMVAGNLTAHYGKIQVGEKDSPVPITYIPAYFGIYPHLTLREMIDWEIKVKKYDKEDVDQKLPLMMEELQLQGRMKHPVSNLSKSQKQLFSLLLAFLGSSGLILLEEPTSHCPPVLRSIMRTFILKYRGHSTILLVSYDPYDAEELADKIAFFCRGHMVAYGSPSNMQQRYVHYTNLVIWPSATFSKSNIRSVEKIIAEVIPEMKDSLDYEMLPNEALRFPLPNIIGSKITKVLVAVDAIKSVENIKHLELVRQNIHDAYNICCAGKQEIDYRAAVEPLRFLYYAERKKTRFMSQLKSLWALRKKFWKRKLMPILLLYFIPYAFLFFLCVIATLTDIKTHTMHLIPDNLDMTLSTTLSSKYTNLLLGDSNMEVNQMQESELRQKFADGYWIYDEDQTIGLIVNSKNETSFLTLATAPLTEFFVNQMIANYHLIRLMKDAGATPKASIDAVLQSADHPDVIHYVMAPGEGNAEVSFLLGLSRRAWAAIIAESSWSLLCVGTSLMVFLTQISFFYSQLGADDTITLYYHLGVSPMVFWLMSFVVDLIHFLVHITITVLPFFLIIAIFFDKSFYCALVAYVVLLCCYLSMAPFIYIVSYSVKNVYVAYFAVFFIPGLIAIMPGILPIFQVPFGDRFQTMCDLMTLSSLLFPSLSATLLAGTSPEIFEKFTTKNNGDDHIEFFEIMKTVCPLFISFLIYFLGWLVLALDNSFTCKRFYTRAKALITYPFGEKSQADQQDLDAVNVSILGQPAEQIAAGETIESGSQTGSAGARQDAGADLEPAPTQTGDPQSKINTQVPSSKKEQMPSSGSNKNNNNKSNMRRGVTELRPVTEDDKAAQLGLWSHRDREGSVTPVLGWDGVALTNNFDDWAVSILLFEGQIVNIFGDLPESRTMIMDAAVGRQFPTRGRIHFKEKDIQWDSAIGYVPNEEKLCSFLTGRETLTQTAILKLYDDPTKIVDFLLKTFQLEDVGDHQVSSYTVQTVHLLSLCVALIDRPKVLLLDETSMYMEPAMAKMMWAAVGMLRETCQTATLFSSSKASECEQCASHTAMLYRGAVSLGATTVDIKRRFSVMLTLYVTLHKVMRKETATALIEAQISDAVSHFHPHPDKITFIINISEGKYAETYAKVRNIMASFGMNDYYLETPDLDMIYAVNFTAFA